MNKRPLKLTIEGEIVTKTKKMPFTMLCNRQNNKKEQIFKSKSILKKRKYAWTHSEWHICLVFLILPSLINCQFPTRDPRWYSREGDYNYQWPNPGDPEYR